MEGGDDFDRPDEFAGDDHQVLKHSIAAGKRVSFKPWHKPRKQWIRMNQWGIEISKLLGQFDTKPDSISYLSLPGSDLLDIRAIHEICEQHSITLRYLGYNAITATDDEREHLQISESEVSRLPNINNEQSRIVLDRLENVAKDDSLAHENTVRAAPFDVINIDLCGSLELGDGIENAGTFDSIAKIISIQKNKRTDPWIMFLTTRSRKGKVSTEVVEKFLLQIQKNCHDHEKFGSLLELCTNLRAGELGSLQANVDEIENSKFKDAFVVGITKWLIGIANNSQPEWSIEMLDSFCYDIRGGHKDMISYAFLFRMQQSEIDDSHGLATMIGRQQVSVVDEITQAISALEQISNITDVDQVLAANIDFAKAAEKASRELLEIARYDGNAYSEWVSNGCPTI